MGIRSQTSALHLEKLKSIPLFEAIKDNDEAMEKITSICSTKKFHKGDHIITEAETGDELFILLEGAVNILKRTRSGDDYVVVNLRAEFNIFIGEMALIDDDKRSASVVATENCEVLVIGKSDFLNLGNNNPEIGLPITRALAKIVAGRLRKTNEDMMTLFDALLSEIEG